MKIIRPYLTFLCRNKTYTIINVSGFSISLMFVILIGLYVQQEYNVDKIHTKAERIYAIGYSVGDNGQTKTTMGTNWRIQNYIKKRYPEIESSCAINRENIEVNLTNGDKLRTEAIFTDSTFYHLFDFELAEGDRNHVLDDINSCVISEEFAKQMFGNNNPIGKPLTYNDSTRLIITGVAKKMEDSSIKQCDIIVRFENLKDIDPALMDEYMSNATSTDLFFLLKPGTDLRSKSASIDRYMKVINWYYKTPGYETHIYLEPFSKMYFSDYPSVNENTERGDLKTVNILFAVGIVILLFSIFNYINLTVAQSNRRAREMATRRLFGSSRNGIIIRLVTESIVLCFAALIIGLGMALALAPCVGKLLGTEIMLSNLIKPINISIIISFVLVVGVISGLLPAILISRCEPIDVVRGTFRTHTKMFFSKIFIIIQCTITIILLACSLTMIMQVHHLIYAPMGYDTENIVRINNISTDSVKISTFMERLRRLPFVKAATACCGTPFDGGNNNTEVQNGKTISFQYLEGDSSFMDVFGLKLEKKYDTAEKEKYYINHQALAETGMKTDAKEMPYNRMMLPISGILKDFHIRNMMSEQHPLIVNITNDEFFIPWVYAIKIKGNAIENYEKIKSLHKEIFKGDIADDGHPFIGQQMQDSYSHEIRISKVVSLFAFIAIVISLLGLIAMSTYFIQQKQKEIAIRKVFGSTDMQMLSRLIRSFMFYVVIAFLIAVPVIYYFMHDWLSGYSYRISLSPWIFIAAGAFCFIISFIAVIIQSYIASNENPVKHIKGE